MGRKKVAKGKRSNNEGTIVQLPSGRWRVQLSLGYKDDGSRNRVSNILDTEKEAVAWKNKTLATSELYGKDSVRQTNEYFVPSFHKWLLDVKQNEVYSQQFKRMMDYYKKHIRPYFLKVKQKEITKIDFERFFKHLDNEKVGMESRRKVKSLLKQYFEKEYEDTPMRNPLDGIRLEAKIKKEVIDPSKILSNEEYKAIPKEIRLKFLNALDTDKFSPFLKPLCYLMYFAGNRVGETLPYQWKDFNFDKRYFIVYKAVTREYKFDENGNSIGKSTTAIKPPKSDKGCRPLPLLDVLYEVLKEWYDIRKAEEKLTGISFTAPDDYIFANNKGDLRTEYGTYTIFSRFLKRNNLYKKGIHFQALRQTFSNTLFAEDTDEKMITDLMGHTEIKTTKQHYRSIEQFDSVQKAALKFNAMFKPKDPKFCADESITFAPDEYMTEQTAIQSIEIKQSEIELLPSKKPLSDLLSELATYPEFIEMMTKTKKKESEME